jgi:hypothetical protein
VQSAVDLDMDDLAGRRSERRIEIAPPAIMVTSYGLAGRHRQAVSRAEPREVHLAHRLCTARDVDEGRCHQAPMPHGAGQAELLEQAGSRRQALLHPRREHATR